MKQMSTPPFWGDVGVKKWSPFLDSGTRSPIFGHLKMPKVPIFRCPKMGLRAPESKNGDHFFTRTPPQNGGLGICFMCLPRKVIFGHFIDFEYFGSDFSCFYIVKTPPKDQNFKWQFQSQFWVYNAEIFLWAPITQWHHICRRQNVTQKKSFCGTP